jgi:zinc D-Ala-D-Ala carboxypeptidase
MRDLRLSKNFWLREFLASRAAALAGIEIVPTDEQIDCMEELCETVLEPIRDIWGRPIAVISGLRNEAVNRKVGGARNSAHLYGCAADIIIAGVRTRDVQRAIKQHLPELVFDQVIDEFEQWTHIGIARPGRINRFEFLTARKVNLETVYERVA